MSNGSRVLAVQKKTMADAETQEHQDGEQAKKKKSEQKLVKGVLPRNFAAGPHGLGDPNDKSLRKLEKQVLIPQKIRDKTRTEKCVDIVKAFNECGKREGMLSWLYCREENRQLWACAEKWWNDKDFVEECTQEYLRERSEYRRTGIGVKQQRRMRGATH